MSFQVFETEAKTILSATSGFIAQAGFTHSLSPARNCGFGCTYCYVPTMRIQAGLKPEDWRRWGQFTTFKTNVGALLARQLRPGQRIYCSPLVDPYQPAEEQRRLMPELIAALIDRPPDVFCIQTRGPLVTRDVDALVQLGQRCTVRISFSLTTDREEIRRWYEPHCAPVATRLKAMRALRDAGLLVHATLAPILPCDPERLANCALEASNGDVIADPLHQRVSKPTGATTRPEALRVSERRGLREWHQSDFQQEIVTRIATIVNASGRRFGTGPQAFAWLSTPVTT